MLCAYCKSSCTFQRLGSLHAEVIVATQTSGEGAHLNIQSERTDRDRAVAPRSLAPMLNALGAAKASSFLFSAVP